MINWRGGRGGFVGGIKHLVKGVFQQTYSSTSAAPTPDCFVGFISVITDGTDTSNVVFVSGITDTSTFIGSICND